MKMVKTLPMPPYFYQEPEWLKPRRKRVVIGVHGREVILESIKQSLGNKP